MNQDRSAIAFGALIWIGLSLLFSTNTHAQLGPQGNAIGEAYQKWVEVTNAKDLERWASFLAPGAFFLPPNSPVLRGEKSIKDFYAQLFGDSLFSLTCRQDSAQVSASEDLAWATGHCEATFTGPDGKEAHGSSKWFKVWKRQATGEWKCLVNTWNSTLAK